MAGSWPLTRVVGCCVLGAAVWMMKQAKVREIREKILIIYLNNQVSLNVDDVMRKWTKKHGEGSEQDLLLKIEERYGKASSPQPHAEPEPDRELGTKAQVELEPEPWLEHEPELEGEAVPERTSSAEPSATPRAVALLVGEPRSGAGADAGRDALPVQEGRAATDTAAAKGTGLALATNGPERSIFDEDDDDWLQAGGFDSPSPPTSPASPARKSLAGTTQQAQRSSATPIAANTKAEPKASPGSAAAAASAGRTASRTSGTTFADFQRSRQSRTKAVSARDRALGGSDSGNASRNGSPVSGRRGSPAAGRGRAGGATSRGSPAGRRRGRADAGRRDATRAKYS